MRPVERAAASLVSWIGGGVQPSNRGKIGMFCDASPIWRFLAELNAREEPEEARAATGGLHVIEVFPAVALPSIDQRFFGRLAAPRYNPARRKTFRAGDWVRVANAASSNFERLGFAGPLQWCEDASRIEQPRNADQDKLDAMLCLLIGLLWRLGHRSESMLLGCLTNGYMVLPASSAVRERITTAARKGSVPVDGIVL
jgi:predicted RNase H-like nuclease